MTARTTEPHVRQMIADRELETWLVVDASASIDFGTTCCTKRDLTVAAAAPSCTSRPAAAPARGDHRHR